MRTALVLGIVIVGATLSSGCNDHTRRRVVDTHDVFAPSEPRDVHSVTGDGQVTLYWSRPADADLAGFGVFISQDDYDYYLVAEVSTSQRHFVISDEVIPVNVPFDFVNGNTFFLGVTAFDWDGNESELTTSSTTFDTPRPSGLDLVLYDAAGNRSHESGYDFSRSPYGYAMSGQDLFADIYFVVESGRPVMRTAHPQVVEMQDMGVHDFDDDAVGWVAPEHWQPSSRVPLALGHVVLVKIYEESRPGNPVEPFNVAKFQVTALGPGWVSLDWAYQIAPNNPELKPGVTEPIRPVGTREVRR